MKSKDYKTALVEYCSSLSDEDIRFLGTRLVERYSGDLGNALNILSKDSRVHYILDSAQGANDLYQLCDVIRDLIVSESKKRKINLWDASK